MQSGLYNQLFEVFAQTEQKDEAGQTKNQWLPIGKFWGRVEPVSTNAFVQSGAQGSALVCRVKMRMSDFNVIAAHRIRDMHSNDVYDIQGVIPIPNDNEKALMCSVGSLLA